MNNKLLINYTTLLILYRILYITFTFHVSSFNNTFSQKKKKKRFPITHTFTHEQNQQHASIVISLSLLIYYIKVINKKVKKSQPQVIYEIGRPTTKETQTSLIL